MSSASEVEDGHWMMLSRTKFVACPDGHSKSLTRCALEIYCRDRSASAGVTYQASLAGFLNELQYHL